MQIRLVLFATAGIIIASVCTMMMPRDAYAHGAGLTFTATTTPYFVDVDYSDFFIYAGELGRFDLMLFSDEERAKPVDFSKVWIRIVQRDTSPRGDTLFSGWIGRPEFGPTGFSIVLPDIGSYDLVVRYVKGDKIIADTTFALTVIEGRSSGKPNWRTYIPVASGALAAVIATITAAIFIRRHRR